MSENLRSLARRATIITRVRSVQVAAAVIVVAITATVWFAATDGDGATSVAGAAAAPTTLRPSSADDDAVDPDETGATAATTSPGSTPDPTDAPTDGATGDGDATGASEASDATATSTTTVTSGPDDATQSTTLTTTAPAIVAATRPADTDEPTTGSTADTDGSSADEPAAPGPAGQTTSLVAPSEQPGRPQSWQATPVDPLDPPDPDPVPVPALPTTSGGLVVNAYGCQLNCIQHALIVPGRLHADVGIDLATKVPTSAYVFVSETEPVMGPHGPVMSVWANPFHLDETTSWSTATTGLEFDTTYWISILVIDDHDNERWAMTSYHTVANPIQGQEAAAGSECYFQCLVGATVSPGDSPWSSVDIEIRMTSAAPNAWAVVSTADPVFVDGIPTLEYQNNAFSIVADDGAVVRGRVTGLAADTTYHILVSAVDDSNFASYALGEFHTDQIPDVDVRVRWERVYIHHDGDPGAGGRGELSMSWGLGFEGGATTAYGTRSEEKIGDGTSVVLNSANWTWVSTHEGGVLPSVIVNVRDRDGAYVSGCDGALTTLPDDGRWGSCDVKTNVAWIELPSLETIRSLPSCESYGLAADQAQDRCLVRRSERTDDTFPAFDALISFRVVDG